MPSASSQPDLASPWGEWGTTLVTRLQTLTDGESLTVLAPERLARPCKPRVGLVKRILGQKYELTPGWITLRREDALVRATSVSDDREVGFPLSPEEKASLARLGWRAGGPTDGPGLQRWFPDDVPTGPYLPEVDARAAASIVAVTMREVFGVDDPADLSLT